MDERGGPAKAGLIVHEQRVPHRKAVYVGGVQSSAVVHAGVVLEPTLGHVHRLAILDVDASPALIKVVTYGDAISELQTVDGDVVATHKLEAAGERLPVDNRRDRAHGPEDQEIRLVLNDQAASPDARTDFDAISGLRIIDGALEIHHIDMRLLPAVSGGDGK